MRMKILRPAALVILSECSRSHGKRTERPTVARAHLRVSNETNLPLKRLRHRRRRLRLGISALPGWSGSTPIIWRDWIFLSSAKKVMNSHSGVSIDLKVAVLWKRPFGGGNVKMRKQNMSSPSPVTDGQIVYVLTGIFKAFDFNGNEDIGQVPHGELGLNWGYASSPLLFDDSLYPGVPWHEDG